MNFFKKALITITLILLFGAFYQILATQIDELKYRPLGELIDVGGYKLHIYCTGEDSGPTIILDAGWGCNSLHWTLVQKEVTKFAKVCSYDRAGNGFSDLRPAPGTSLDMVTELHTLLINAQVKSPYILVGHSLGGINMRLFSSIFPNEVAGVVLVDSPYENQGNIWPKRPDKSWLESIFTTPKMQMFLTSIGALRWQYDISNTSDAFPQDIRNIIVAKWRTNNFMINRLKDGPVINESFAQLSKAGGLLGTKPLIVITADPDTLRRQCEEKDKIDPKSCQEFVSAWLNVQDILLTKSLNSKQLIAQGSGHMITEENPEVIVEAIKELHQNLQ
jgi:pimeloyl-ACP methyl ester carboxylesterase